MIRRRSAMIRSLVIAIAIAVTQLVLWGVKGFADPVSIFCVAVAFFMLGMRVHRHLYPWGDR